VRMDRTIKKKEAKWISDKITLDKHYNKIKKDDNGFFHKIDRQSAENYMRVSLENADRWVEEQNRKIKEEKKEEECDAEINELKLKQIIKKNYWVIKEILEKYMDMKPDYYTLTSLWICGTYLHKNFYTYPYLFFNAMRGSGKSRILELIAELSKDGIFTKAPTEAVLFRTTGTLSIDEFERVSYKEKIGVRELLNSAYKKGIKIMRMKKKKVDKQEEQVVEEFEPYRPIVMANIWGMEEVLGDRCITLILEKSNDLIKTRLVQDYQTNEIIQNTKKNLNVCSLCNVVYQKNIYKQWNNYIIDKYNTTLTTQTYITTHTTQTTQHLSNTIKLNKLFNKIDESKLSGRNLELFLPLYFIAFNIDDFILDDIIRISKEISQERLHEEETESKDILLYDFISQKPETRDFKFVKELTAEFKQFIDEDDVWINTKWMGRALKRLDLVVDKRRKTKGVEVTLNVKKAGKKIKMFRK